ncbi:PAQR family membrane homeostasis protein TrhA [Solilutibacter tolerans]|uniref:Hemolysin III n=1 Tax=Solilutibacter tolerans TaxID=1604334 RepID=A0A1N6U3M3_9GAMM|nr:hemolysin III family protein [Lysobacter tolerans]SIQ60248.1 hemolysin III [Lysobacter tolerans]
MGASTTSAYSPREERANVLTHGIGAGVALVAGLTMLTLSIGRGGDPWQWASAIVFSISMLMLYLASTAYHRAVDPVRRARLKIVDHCAIYVLIAGTYTPFTLTVLRDTVGWTLFIAIWSLAAIGIIFKLFFTGRFKLVSTLIYIAMGWLVMLYAKPVYQALSGWTFGWLLAGGIAYTLGTVFYMQRRMPYAHAVWHCFVVIGTVCHFISVWSLVVPRA